MSESVVVNVGGAVTAVALFGFGLFVYPWLLRKGGAGKGAVAVISMALVALFYRFDAGRNSVAVSLGLAVLWAAFPVAVGLVANKVATMLPPPRV